jgi:membrane protease YdiL (CAAX protease family)
VNSVEAGSIVGEMSFFQHRPTSASVRAHGDVEALVLDRSSASREALGPVYDVVRGNVGELVMDRQREVSDRHVAFLRKSEQHERERREFGVFFSVIVVIVGFDHAIAEIARMPAISITSQGFSWGALLTFAIPLVFFVRYTKQPWSTFGLTLYGWRKSLAESLLWALPLVVAAAGGKLLYQRLGWVDPTEPLFSTQSLRESAMLLPGVAGIVISRVQGFFHHGMQELLMRGVIQGSLARLYARESPWWAIFATSTFFATAHIFISPAFALMTFFGGIGFGWLYSRHKTLLGVTVLHFILHTTTKLLGFL